MGDESNIRWCTTRHPCPHLSFLEIIGNPHKIHKINESEGHGCDNKFPVTSGNQVLHSLIFCIFMCFSKNSPISIFNC